jgi:hypothetical protein
LAWNDEFVRSEDPVFDRSVEGRAIAEAARHLARRWPLVQLVRLGDLHDLALAQVHDAIRHHESF